ncbi:hypothetical protein [Dictyobacter kobayashii]|uniref:DUF304 domain-containing protein n=1 Tax=Dictyobacter kobayashii TaxID=2014872 RepID=A0A402AVP7_9CHLR|nr:hypothetical protein [Dictyobacter kobayashii]GCE23167.1 hypothetical protein KDK_69670 [Dictyobacter kobayashii]
MEPRQEVEFPRSMYQLAEQHHVGQPLALYNLNLQWKRYLSLINYFSLIAMSCAILFILVVASIFFYQVIKHQILDVQFGLIMILFGTFMCFVGCAFLIYIRHIYKYWSPQYVLICAEGFLVVSPKKVTVVYWNEVRGLVKVPGIGKRKNYMLYRIHQNSLTLSNIYEEFDGLIDLIKQHIPQQL